MGYGAATLNEKQNGDETSPRHKCFSCFRIGYRLFIMPLRL